MQLLILVEGVGQLVHSLGRKERKKGKESSGLRTSHQPQFLCCLAWRSGLRLLPGLLPLFLHLTHKKSRAGSCR